MKHYQIKENWKNNAMSTYKISYFVICSGFSLKKDIIMHLLQNKCKKHNFWMDFQPKIWKL
jgi:hypothetical protein